MYEDFPDAAFISAVYENIGTEAIEISKSVSNYFIVDESMIASPGELSGFWTFQGASYKWQQDYVFRLPAGFESRNYFGMNSPEAAEFPAPFQII